MSKSPKFGARYYEDPSISRCSAAEYGRLWGAISRRVAQGESFYRAREIALAEEIPDMAKAYGKEVAYRVQKAIHHTSPDNLPKWARAASKDKFRETMTEHLIKRDGKVSLLNRIFLRLTGIPLY